MNRKVKTVETTPTDNGDLLENPADIVAIKVAETVNELTTDAVKRVLDRLPDLIQAAITTELNTPERREALQAMQERLTASGGGAVDNFLARKLQPLPPAPSPKLLASELEPTIEITSESISESGSL